MTIGNLNGSISIRGSDTTGLTLHAIKKAAGAEQLKNININVAAETGSISISTSVVPLKKKTPLGAIGTVDYELTLPRTVRIARVDLEDGKVLIEGMRGEDVRANVVNGQLTARNCCANLHLTIATATSIFPMSIARRGAFSPRPRLRTAMPAFRFPATDPFMRVLRQ